MTINEACRTFELGERTIRRWIRDGVLTARRVPHKFSPVGYAWELDPEEVRKIAKTRARRPAGSKEIPPHLLPAFHVFVRAVAAGVEHSKLVGAIARVAAQVTLVETEAEAEAIRQMQGLQPEFWMRQDARGRWCA